MASSSDNEKLDHSNVAENDSLGSKKEEAISADTIKKYLQIVQKFYSKSALLILRRRAKLPVEFSKDQQPLQVKKVDKWFQIEVDATTAFCDELRLWNGYDMICSSLPGLIIETYLDVSRLKENDMLLIKVGTEYRNVFDFLEDARAAQHVSRLPKIQYNEIMLERWAIQYQCSASAPDEDFYHLLPKIYKGCVVFMRSLYTVTSILPTWRLLSRLQQDRQINDTINIGCRVLSGNDKDNGVADKLLQPLFGGDFPVTGQFSFDKTDLHLGSFSAEVTYRNRCELAYKIGSTSDIYPFTEEGYLSRPKLDSISSLYDPSEDESNMHSFRSSIHNGYQLNQDHYEKSLLRKLNTTTALPISVQNATFLTEKPDRQMSPSNRKRRASSPPIQETLSPLHAIRSASEATLPYLDNWTARSRLVYPENEEERDRGRPTTRSAGIKERKRSSSIRSNASSGRCSSPGSLRNISVAPMEFDPSTPTLRHSFSSPDLRNWCNVRAGSHDRNSLSGVSDRAENSFDVEGNTFPENPFRVTNDQAYGSFICECCSKMPKTFDTMKELKAHEVRKQYRCQYCAVWFKTRNDVEQHQNSSHLGRYSWSCATISDHTAVFHPTPSRAEETVTCGYCGEEFPRASPLIHNASQNITLDQNHDAQVRHLVEVHKFRGCNHAKKFFREDHFRQHLKHSHAGKMGKWANGLINAFMTERQLDPILLAQSEV